MCIHLPGVKLVEELCLLSGRDAYSCYRQYEWPSNLMSNNLIWNLVWQPNNRHSERKRIFRLKRMHLFNAMRRWLQECLWCSKKSCQTTWIPMLIESVNRGIESVFEKLETISLIFERKPFGLLTYLSEWGVSVFYANDTNNTNDPWWEWGRQFR